MDTRKQRLQALFSAFILMKADLLGRSAATGKHCVLGHLGLVFIWSCFAFCLLFLLFYVISALVPAKAAIIAKKIYPTSNA